MSTRRKAQQTKKSSVNLWILAGIAVLAALAFYIFQGGPGGDNTADSPSTPGEGITIVKSEITPTAKFIPYNAGGTKMEVVAVKAPDGTIRTAFNTCQVCYNSGRGYYEQSGDQLICQNCGNRFNIDQVEKTQGGCNPVPILEGYKTEDGTTIKISDEFLVQNRTLFGNWKK